MTEFLVRCFDPSKGIPYAQLFAPGTSHVETSGFEFETRPTRLSLRTVLSGEVTYEADGLRYVLRPGEFAVVGSGLRVLGGTAKRSETVCLSCYAKDVPTTELWPENIFVRLRDQAGKIDKPLEQLVKAHKRSNVSTVERQFDRFMDIAMAQLSEVFGLRQSLDQKRSRTRNDLTSKLLHARDLVDANLKFPIDIDLLSRECGISRYHLTRLFKTAFGETPKSRHERLRLAASAQLLSSTRQPIRQIAEEFGYKSLASYSRAFSGAMGVSPSEHRRRS